MFHRSAEWCQYCRSQLVELELSRPLFETKGVRIAAISYDSQEALSAFAQQHSIGYSLLSDRGSETIKKFGIFNHNMAPGLRAFGVPHPVEYLVSSDGTVVGKYFVPNYMNRVTGASVALRELGATGEDAPTVLLRDGALSAEFGFPAKRVFSGQELAFFAHFTVEPGWHVYGPSAPKEYTPLEVRFDDTKVQRQCLSLPEAEQMDVAVLGEYRTVLSRLVRGDRDSAVEASAARRRAGADGTTGGAAVLGEGVRGSAGDGVRAEARRAGVCDLRP